MTMNDHPSEKPLTEEELAYMRWLENPAQHQGPVPESWQEAQASWLPRQADLRATMPASMEPPYPEFFNAQLMRRLAEEKPQAEANEEATPFWAQVREWFLGSSRGWAWGTVGATAALVCFSWLALGRGSSSSHTTIVSAYSPELGQVPSVQFSKEAQAIIIDLQGLEAYPAERTIIGMNGDEPETLVAKISAQ
jgi:hypothetical protein